MTAEATHNEGPGDPTERTVATLHREISTLEDKMDTRFDGFAREARMAEAHRLELKADNQKTVDTAMIAAEKAVQAALAAAEKARDQQTIASQLATSLAQEGSKEQMKQQAETFSTAITSLTAGLGDVKSLLSELRAEKRGGKDVTSAMYAFAGFIVSLVVVGGAILALRP